MKPNIRRHEAANTQLVAVLAVIVLGLGVLGWEWESAHPSARGANKVIQYHRHHQHHLQQVTANSGQP